MKSPQDHGASRKPMDQAAWQRFKHASKEWARRNTFEAMVEQLEAICRRTPGVWPNRAHDARPEQFTEAWYAEEILFAINSARHHIEADDPSYAAVEALGIGVLAAEAGARIGGTEIQRWLERVGNESKEQWLKGEVVRTVALADQITETYSDKRYGLDMEVEFKDDAGKPTGERLFLQLKSGDSHLRTRRRDGAQIFRIRNEDHATYWMNAAYPVFLVIGNSRGDIRWMEIRSYLSRESNDAKRPLRQVVFTGERFTVASLLRWRNEILCDQGKLAGEISRPTPLHRTAGSPVRR